MPESDTWAASCDGACAEPGADGAASLIAAVTLGAGAAVIVAGGGEGGVGVCCNTNAEGAAGATAVAAVEDGRAPPVSPAAACNGDGNGVVGRSKKREIAKPQNPRTATPLPGNEQLG